MRSWPSYLIGAFILLAATHCVAIDGEKKERTEYFQWVWPVTVEGDGKEVIEAAGRLRDSLGVKFNLQTGAKQNPGCCFWIQITKWKPNPGKDGYVVIIQPGGAWLQASNVEQLQAAIKRVGEVARIENGKTELPVGMLTNYELIANP